MNLSPSPVSSKNADFGVSEIQARLRRLERRELLVWGNAVVIILSLTAAIISLSASLYLKGARTIFGLDLGFAVRALVVLVLIFTAHMIFQHLRLRKTQRDLEEQQIQAEVFRRMAMFDPLTGLYNRRFAEERLAAEISRSARKGLSLIVVLVDVNDFKKINDNYGHPAGDHVLKEFAKRLNRSTRGSDLAVRWGGDEFLMVLLDCELNQLQPVLDRLEGFKVELNGREFPISLAVGWKAYEPGDCVADLIEKADKNLYLNKAKVKEKEEVRPVPALA
jgi:diguanylate cyclase (GGDEF)-like protein